SGASAARRLRLCRVAISFPARRSTSMAGSIAAEIIDSGLNAAGLVLHTGEAEAELDAGDAADHHQLVHPAEMADAEYLAGDLAEAGAERHVVILEDDGAQLIGIDAFRHHDRGQRIGVSFRILAEDIEAPMAHRAPRRFGHAFM